MLSLSRGKQTTGGVHCPFACHQLRWCAQIINCEEVSTHYLRMHGIFAKIDVHFLDLGFEHFLLLKKKKNTLPKLDYTHKKNFVGTETKLNATFLAWENQTLPVI